MAARGNDLELDRAVIEMIVALLADQAHQAAFIGLLARRRDVPAGEVARTDVNHLALLHQRIEALPDFIPRAGAIDVVHLVEIDPVRLQASEAALAVLANLVSAQAGAVAVHLRQVRLPINRVVDLRCEHNRVAAAAALRQPAPDNLLGEPLLYRPAVDVSRVEEIDAEFQRPVHDRETVLFRGMPAKIHRSKTDIADQYAVLAQPSVFHRHVCILEKLIAEYAATA